MKKAGNNEVIKKAAKTWSRFAVTMTFVLVAIMAVLIADSVSALPSKSKPLTVRLTLRGR